MNRVRAFLPLAFLSSLVLPLYARAADLPLLSSGWSLVPEACRSCPCGFAGIMGTAQNFVNMGISIGILFSVIIMAWAGLLYISTPTNPEARSQANKMLINAAIGLLIVLTAWLMVDFVMKALYSGPDNQQGKFGPWNSILTGGDTCIESTTVQPLFTGAITALQLAQNSTVTTTSSPTTGRGSSTCSPPASQNNACSVTNLQKTCFASRASDASGVCMVESRGGTVSIRSGSDLLNKGKGPSYSWGLWQINLTTTKLTSSAGESLDCPTAFTHPCQGEYIRNQGGLGWCDSSVKNQALYDKCVAAAQDPKVNTAAACKLYNQSGANGGFQPWVYTTTKVCHYSVH